MLTPDQEQVLRATARYGTATFDGLRHCTYRPLAVESLCDIGLVRAAALGPPVGRTYFMTDAGRLVVELLEALATSRKLCEAFTD